MSPAASVKGRSKTNIRTCWFVLALSFVGLIAVQRQIESRTDTYSNISDILYFRTGATLRAMCLGHEGLMADIYWTRVVQYFGREHMAGSDGRYELLAPLLRVTTDLDPQLIVAYRFGAIFLMTNRPVGAGDPQAAIKLLRQGIVANPDYWRFWQDLGFVYYWELHDYKMASRMFEVGSQRPGAGFWLKALAGTVAAKGGDLETSRFLWSEIYRNADTDAVRNTAKAHLVTLKAKTDMAKLDDLLNIYQQKTGHAAQSIRDLINLGLLKGFPEDPSGVPYVIGRDGRAALGAGSQVDLKLLS